MAANFRFGSSTGGCKILAGERAELPEETDDKGNCDPDKLSQCPYDKNHLIRASRFPYHLLKCKKNHPKLAKELKTCPFNARHLFPPHELTHHIETCEDRISLDPHDDGSADRGSKWNPSVNNWVNPNMSEDWDKEADDNAAPFVWGTSVILNQSRVELKPTNNLSPGFRRPNVLPWAGFKP